MDFNQSIDFRILDSLYGGVYIINKEGSIEYWNKAAEEITGFTAKEVIGKKCSDNILTHIDAEGNNLCLGMCPLKTTINDGKAKDNDVFLHHKKGHRVPVSVRTNTLLDDTGNIIGGIELFTDNSTQQLYKIKIQELEKLAMQDSLTKLPNRNYLQHELSTCFAERRRIKMDFGLLYIDIDHFKKFNDSYGHDVGDKVLIFVSETFLKNARPFDVYGRWGGEEFLAIIRNIDANMLLKVADRMRLLVQNSYLMIEEEKLGVTISIGATLVRDNDSIESMIKRADTSLYHSKENGRNQVSDS